MNFSLLAVVVLLLSASACSNSKKDVVTVPIVDGPWRITYYWDRDHEETSQFTDYTFSFLANNVLEANNGGSKTAGTWMQGTDDSTPKLILAFGVAPLSDLNEDWHILEQSSNRIKLQHISGGDGHIDYLTFERD